MKIRKFAQLVILVLVISITNINSAFAEDTVVPSFIPHYAVWTNATEAVKKEEKTETILDISTLGKENGSYSTYLYDVTPRNWNKLSGLSIFVENDDQSLLFNIILNTADGKKVQVQDNSFIAWRADGSDIWDSVLPYNDQFEVPPGFKGEIYIPFSSLFTEESIETFDVQTWGINIITSQNQLKQIKIKNAILHAENEVKERNKLLNFFLTGDSEVQIPVAGESIAQFKLAGNVDNRDFSFALSHTNENIVIDNGGLLTLKTEATEQEIFIIAKSNDGVQASKKVKLVPSWIVGQKADGVSIQIPLEQNVSQIIDENNLILRDGVINSIRISFVILTIGLLISLLLHKKKLNKNEENH